MIKRLIWPMSPQSAEDEQGSSSHLGIWIIALCFAVWVFFFVILLEILLLSVCWLAVRIFFYYLCVGWWLGFYCCVGGALKMSGGEICRGVMGRCTLGVM